MLLKSYKIIISDEVEVGLQKQVKYITLEQHNPLMAEMWLDGIKRAILSLSILPERCPVAPEDLTNNKKSKTIIRHLIYKKSFRVIFTIVKNEVKILSVKHSAQKTIIQ